MLAKVVLRGAPVKGSEEKLETSSLLAGFLLRRSKPVGLGLCLTRA